MRKTQGFVLLAALFSVFILAQNGYCIAKKPSKDEGDRIVIKQTTRPPDVRDMQVATGQIPPIAEEESSGPK